MAKWIRSSDFIDFSVADGVATVRLNRPERRNAEMDARAHLTRAKRDFDADVQALGFKGAVRKRDEPFGTGVARPSW